MKKFLFVLVVAIGCLLTSSCGTYVMDDYGVGYYPSSYYYTPRTYYYRPVPPPPPPAPRYYRR